MLSLLVLFIGGCSGTRTVKFADGPKAGPVVILGDSVANGYGLQDGEGFVDLLSKRIGIEIENLGRNGATTEASIPRVEKEVLPLKPSLVIVELGGNDALNKVELAQTRQNLTTIIERLHKEKIPVLLLGCRGGIFSDKYFDMYEELAETHELAFIPDMLKGILDSPSLKLDAVHPNAKGHALLADRLEPELRRLVGILKK